MRHNGGMLISFSQPLHTLRGEVFMRPTISIEQIQGEPKSVPMTLGYLCCEALPQTLEQKSTQHEKIKVVELQRRLLKEGSQEIPIEEIALMKKAVFKYVAPEFSFLAVEAADLLEGKV